MGNTSNRIVSVVVVTCGKNGYLVSCLDSLAKQLFRDFELTVIANGCKEDFIHRVISLYPSIRMQSNSQNLFYCQALNQGIGAAGGKFILCLNDDVILDKDYIREALGAFSCDGRVGMVSGKILRSDGKTLDSTGLFLTAWRTARERGYGLKDKGRYDQKEYVFGVNGAVAFYRREMLDEIKTCGEYFDSDFHIFYEDLDIAWRAQRLGWRCFYNPAAVAYHVRGGSVRNSQGLNRPCARIYMSNELNIDLIKNRHLALIKNEAFSGIAVRLPFIFAYDLLALIYTFIFRLEAIIKLIGSLKYIRNALIKRRIMAQQIKNKAESKSLHIPTEKHIF